MISREIVLKALQGKNTPRPALGPLAVHFCAVDKGVSIQDFTIKPSVHADCIIRYHEKYQPDAVWISADTWVTAEAMGVPVSFPDEDQPMSGLQEGIVHSAADLNKIPKPNPHIQGRQPLLLEALSRVVEALGKDVFIVGCFDQSPFSLACQVAGLAFIMAKLTEDYPFLEALMEKCLEYSLSYAEAMAESGADMLSTGDSPAGLIGPTNYANIVAPFEKRLFAALKKTGKILSLHICGDSTALLEDMAATGADVLEIDHQVSISKARKIVRDRVALWGNIDPVTILLQGNSREVSSSVRELISEVKDSGCRKFVLSSGCTLAPTTPSENLFAFNRESRSW
ncbi:MAG: uroporphyrinogen decarboxylase family protein [Candidatus Aminicenantes bacterium]|nr:MAG: uroporphyrinogen decarboxylase family protein [Candidatus Aminicenantes bacterium]